jgi:nickel/cobalt transporter (NicO) family protein
MDASILYFPTAVGLGALHALEPGHAKTLTAAYLIGTNGTKRDAVLLGASVAFTHSIVVVLLAAAGVWLGKETFTDHAMYWLQVASGAIVALLGCYLLYRRWPRTILPHPHDHAHPHSLHHHAPDPFRFKGNNVSGALEIEETHEGERFRLETSPSGSFSGAVVRILRPHNVVEEHVLVRQPDDAWVSEQAPDEPHEFEAMLELEEAGRREELVFRMTEPKGHTHDHGHHHIHTHDHGLDDDELAHARAHAATLPDSAVWSYHAAGELALSDNTLYIAGSDGTVYAIAVPEPVSIALLAAGAGCGLVLFRRINSKD